MDYLWTPWRFAYVSTADKTPGCIFCEKAKQDDREALIVYRGSLCYVLLNLFPYNSGHVMVVPYAHTGELQKLPAPAATEMMQLLQKTEGVLRKVYKPEGMNLGMNIGKFAGAGVADHIHMHALPRWAADTNFVTVVGETRVLPEDLGTTWQKLRQEYHS